MQFFSISNEKQPILSSSLTSSSLVRDCIAVNEEPNVSTLSAITPQGRSFYVMVYAVKFPHATETLFGFLQKIFQVDSTIIIVHLLPLLQKSERVGFLS